MSFSRSPVGFACREAILFNAQSIVSSCIVQKHADDLLDPLDSLRICHRGGLVDVLVLLAILDGVIDEWGVCWRMGVDVDVESLESIRNVAGHRDCDEPVGSVVFDVHPQVLGASRIDGYLVVL